MRKLLHSTRIKVMTAAEVGKPAKKKIRRVSSQLDFLCLKVETADRGGSFLGTVTTKGPKPVNLGLALLSNGLAKLHPSFEDSRTAGARDLLAAEAKAREKRLKVCTVILPCKIFTHSIEGGSSGFYKGTRHSIQPIVCCMKAQAFA